MVKLLINLTFKRGVFHGFSISLVRSSSNCRLWELCTFTPFHIELLTPLYFYKVLVMFAFVCAHFLSLSGVTQVVSCGELAGRIKEGGYLKPKSVLHHLWPQLNSHLNSQRSRVNPFRFVNWIILAFCIFILQFFTNNKHDVDYFDFYLGNLTRDFVLGAGAVCFQHGQHWGEEVRWRKVKLIVRTATQSCLEPVGVAFWSHFWWIAQIWWMQNRFVCSRANLFVAKSKSKTFPL